MKNQAKRNAALTREKLLSAAIEEFAARGLAGARIDRIADAAGTSKPMLYNYFGDKEALFEAALTQEVMAAAEVDKFDANDLVEYAGRTYDLLVARPRLWRLLTWYHLERGQDVFALPAGQALLNDKLLGIAAAQAERRINSEFLPNEIVRLVATLTQLWCMAEPTQDKAIHDFRRNTVMRAVAKILAG